MSWLGGHIHSLKEQISVATKEFLSDGSSETADPLAELRIEKAHVETLKNRIESYKSELSSVRNEFNELNLQLESMRIHCANVEDEYKTLLLQRDEKIHNLINELKFQRGEPEGQCSTNDKPVTYLSNSSQLSLQNYDFASNDYSKAGLAGVVGGSFETSQEKLTEGETSLLALRDEISSLRGELQNCKDEKFQEISILQEKNSLIVARLTERVHAAESALLNSAEEKERDLLTDRPTQTDLPKGCNVSIQCSLKNERPGRTFLNNSESTQLLSIDSSLVNLDNAVSQLGVILERGDFSHLLASTPATNVLDFHSIDSSYKSPTMESVSMKLVVLANFLNRRGYSHNSVFTSSSSSQTESQLHHTVGSFHTSSQTDEELPIFEGILRSDSRSSSVCSRDADDYSSSLMRFKRLRDALRAAVSQLPKPQDISPTVHSSSSKMSPTPSPPWPPTQPEAQVAVLAAAEAAGRMELYRLHDMLYSSELTISQLSEEISDLRQRIESTRVLSDSDNESSHFINEHLERSGKQESISVEIQHATEQTPSKHQLELDKVAESYDLLVNLVMSFCLLFKDSYTSDNFEEISARFKISDGSKGDIVRLLKEALDSHEVLKRQTDLLSAEKVRSDCKCCRFTMTDLSKSDAGCQTLALSVDDPSEYCSDPLLQYNATHICHHCAALSEFLDDFLLTLENDIGLSNLPDTYKLLHLLHPDDVDMELNSSLNVQLEKLCTYFLKLRRLSVAENEMNSKCTSSFSENTLEHVSLIAKEILNCVNRNQLEADAEPLKSLLDSNVPIEAQPLVACLKSLVLAYSDLREQYTRVEHDKTTLTDLIRAKHTESQIYHAKLQKMLAEKQALSENGSQDAANLLKLTNEIQRLRSHLVQVEENYTKEALSSEQREASIRKALVKAEQRIATLDEFVANAEQQMECVKEERDAARVACRASQSELACLRQNHANLQKAVENLEREKQTEVSMETRHYRLEVDRLRSEASTLHAKVEELQKSLKQQDDLISTNHALQEQVSRHAGRVAEAHSQARLHEERVKVLQAEKRMLADELNGKLDKSLMKSLLISCLKLPASKRPEAFRMLGSVLNFTFEDYKTLGFSEPSGQNWKDWFWKTEKTPSTDDDSSPKASFIEQLAQFLERESAPQSSLKLPTDYLDSSRTRDASQAPHRFRISSTSALYPNNLDVTGESPPASPPSPMVAVPPLLSFTPSSYTPAASSVSSQSKNPLLSSLLQT